MKTLKAMIVGIALLMVCGISQAAPSGHGNSTKDEVINTYLNAVVHGNPSGIDEAIDDDAQFNMKRGERVNTLTKTQIIEALQSNKGVEQDCQCVKTVVQDDELKKVIKVDMKYTDYTRTDIITAEPAGNGWKITRVETSFK